jgi:hypothetical protein
VLERSEADGEGITDRGVEDVDEDVKMEDVRGCRHAMLMYPRIIWIKHFRFLVPTFFDHRAAQYRKVGRLEILWWTREERHAWWLYTEPWPYHQLAISVGSCIQCVQSLAGDSPKLDLEIGSNCRFEFLLLL